jgi:hypothetical protein
LLNIVHCIIVPVICNCDSMNLQNISVTLTFEEGTWFPDATKCCYEIDICAKLFQNPSMHDKVTAWTWFVCKWGQTDISHSCDTLSWFGRHLCQVNPKSFHVWQSYSPDTIVSTYLIVIMWKLIWPWPLR